MIITILILAGIFLFCIIFSATSYSRFLRAYNKYNNIEINCGATGYQLAVHAINMLNLKTKISTTDKDLNDCYYIKKDIIILSKKNFYSSSIASAAIVLHEIGHAVQKKDKYWLFRFSQILALICKIAKVLIIPGIICGTIFLFFSHLYSYGILILILSLTFWFLLFLLKIIAIPVEINASKIAYNFLKEHNILNNSELKQAKKMLRFAIYTYFADLFSGVLAILRSFRR